MRSFILTFIFSTCAFGQGFDTSNNAALHGDYFVREILIAGQNGNGTISSASSAIGVATFDGAGNYTFAGAAGRNNAGTYGVGSNGLLYIQSFIDGSQDAFGGLSAIGPGAFVASATEGTSGDIIIGIPAGSGASAASLSGNYSAGYVSFPNQDVTQVREASFGFTADGAGNLSNVAVSGTALNLGGNPVSQTISGGTYSLTGEGTGAMNLGAASSSQVLSGSLNFYVSADGNLFMAGTPGGYDLIVGGPAFNGSASNANFNNVYFIGGFEDQVSGATHALDAFYGSWNANGQGTSIAHERFQPLAQNQLGVFDYTFDSQDTFQSNATASPADINYQLTLAAGGQLFIGTGTQGLYSLLVGFAAPHYSGAGVYLNPLGIVNGANYAPITNPVAPGEIITLFGSGLAPGTSSPSGLPLPAILNGVQVMINGQAAPLIYASSSQIDAIVPQSVTPGNNVDYATIQVINNGAASNSVTLYTNYTAPGMFSAGGNGTGPAAAQLSDNSQISLSNPASIGSTVMFYATGLGSVSPAVADGSAAPSNPPATATDTDYVYVGGQPENLIFDGLTPDLVSLYQLNATLAQGTPTATDFADIATPDAYTSEATIAVGGGSAIAQARQQAMKAKGPRRPGLAGRSTAPGMERK